MELLDKTNKKSWEDTYFPYFVFWYIGSERFWICTLHGVHYKGKCSVKSGSYDDLEPRCTALLEAGLTAEIQ